MDKKSKIIFWVLTIVIVLCAVLIVVTQWSRIKAEIVIGDPLKHPDYAGTLTIPSQGIDVPLIMVNNPDMLQMVVDKTNCAVLFKKVDSVVNGQEKGASWIIGDHSSQNFKTLHQAAVGDKAKIVNPDGVVSEFVVTKNFIGYNISEDLIYEDGTSVRNDNPDGIILYACVDETAVPVYIVFLQPV